MGVILVNMISGRNPWRYATTDDQCFQAYLRDNDFLGNVLPISAEANAIIKRIFTIDPLNRITLEGLKDEIIQVGTFFRSHQQLSLDPKPAQPESPIMSTDSGWQTESEPIPAKPVRDLMKSEGGLLSSPVLRSPAAPSQTSFSNGQHSGIRVPTAESNSKPSSTSASAVDSSKSSLAVKTPSVHAVTAVSVVRPDGGPDDDVAEPLALPGSLLDNVLRSPGGKPKSITIKTGRNMFRAAVQRFKEFSAPTSTSTGNVGA
jgi:serine/threonine protein kinase